MLKSKKFWGIILSLIFFWLALKDTDLTQVLNKLSDLKTFYLPIILVSLTFEYFLRSIRWKTVLNFPELSLKHSFYSTVSGYFFNNILPGRAGEFVKSWYINKKTSKPISSILGSMVFERFSDGVITLGMLCIALQSFKSNDVIHKASVAALIFYGGLLISLIIYKFFTKQTCWLINAVCKLLPKKISSKASAVILSFAQGFTGIISKPFLLFKTFMWSIAAWAATSFTHYLWLSTFSIEADLNATLLLVSVIALGSMIPSAPGNIGIYEYCCVLVLSDIIGIPRESAAAFGIVSHTINYIFTAIEGIIILNIENLSIKSTCENQK